ncbi:FMN-dependent NADH-azoreductase [Aeromicrobium chenweiae]|uniref:FMN dependent NADH:quinone oxidoreductase n=1 Tax=Aeromicrobium chenweiae TaxID=2079793 RepID=A0A2S0WLU2_9ACTN|nr:NAD(P)H-dependent oxidoreductase [Aeromicrobium chenweiae]AWB92281.1 ACP phosphodiesterase [Aeromicrobium chenweiae]TGN31435.1 flavodoxin family protein [Aeromicrobium chenweiae]
MTLLRIDATILGPLSSSSELADLVLAAWTAEHPDETVVTRHLGTDPLPSDVWATAIDGNHTPEDQRTDAHRAAQAVTKELHEELVSADHVVLAFPLYNWGVSQHVKTWIDLVLAGGEVGERILEGKPVVLLVTRGGSYAPGTPKEGWDHSVGYLRRVLDEVWGANLTVVEREFTLVGINPALDEFAELGAELKRAAHEAATTAGKALATS